MVSITCDVNMLISVPAFARAVVQNSKRIVWAVPSSWTSTGLSKLLLTGQQAAQIHSLIVCCKPSEYLLFHMLA